MTVGPVSLNVAVGFVTPSVAADELKTSVGSLLAKVTVTATPGLFNVTVKSPESLPALPDEGPEKLRLGPATVPSEPSSKSPRNASPSSELKGI
jgi:hypothetical protein